MKPRTKATFHTWKCKLLIQPSLHRSLVWAVSLRRYSCALCAHVYIRTCIVSSGLRWACTAAVQLCLSHHRVRSPKDARAYIHSSFIHVHTSLCLSLWVYTHISVSVCLCVCVCACVYVYAFMSFSIFLPWTMILPIPAGHYSWSLRVVGSGYSVL